MTETNEALEKRRFSEFNLEPAILEALDEMGYEYMTDIQALTIPKLEHPCDLMAQAPTGTGKTAGFGIPLLNRVQANAGYLQALIIAPTRELAQQITEELSKIARKKGVKIMAVYGGGSVFAQKDEFRMVQPDVVVGTPGRLLDLMGQMVINVSRTRNVILDEADEMLDMGFLPDIEKILKQTPRGRETWLFSATVPSEIRRIAQDYMLYPEEVRVKLNTETAANIEQFYVVVNDEDKPNILEKILKDNTDMYGIVFCQTKRDVVLVARKLRNRFSLESLHGALEQSERERTMEMFRQKEVKILVSTDVTARGIDVDKLTHVINYEPPRDLDSYVHRIGRTARKGESGIAITFFTPDQEWNLRQLEKKIGVTLTKHPESELEFEEGGARRPRGGGSRGGGSHGGRGSNRSRGPRPGGPAARDKAAEGSGASSAGAGKKRRRRPRRKPGAAGGSPPPTEG